MSLGIDTASPFQLLSNVIRSATTRTQEKNSCEVSLLIFLTSVIVHCGLVSKVAATFHPTLGSKKPCYSKIPEVILDQCLAAGSPRNF